MTVPPKKSPSPRAEPVRPVVQNEDLPKDSIKKSEPEKNSEKAPSPEMTADKNSGSKKATIKKEEEPTPKPMEED